MDEKLQYNSPLVYQRADPYVLFYRIHTSV